MRIYTKVFFVVFFIKIISVQAQEDLLALLDSVKEPVISEKVIATFKTSKVINAQSVETVKKRSLDFRITHRFGNIGAASNGGFHTWYGWDAVSDIRLSFDYGITDNITIGLARSKYNELIDGTLKYRFLEQTIDNKIPVSVVLYENMAFNPQKSAAFYNGTTGVTEKFVHRISYINQLVIARKFSRNFSLELLATHLHMNFVKASLNTSNGAIAENDIFSLGLAARYKLTKRLAILADYFQVFSKYRINNSFYPPLAIGVEIETGGHVFHINLTNAPAINENNFLSNSTDSWLDGAFKFGFNISRVF